MEIITMYKAFDGKTFKKDEDCYHYEEKKKGAIMSSILSIMDTCNYHETCVDCPFFTYPECFFGENSPQWWNYKKLEEIIHEK